MCSLSKDANEVKEVEKPEADGENKQEEQVKKLEERMVNLTVYALRVGVKRLKHPRYLMKAISSITLKNDVKGTEPTDKDEEEKPNIDGSKLNDVKGTGAKDADSDEGSMSGMLLNLKLEHS